MARPGNALTTSFWQAISCQHGHHGTDHATAGVAGTVKTLSRSGYAYENTGKWEHDLVKQNLANQVYSLYNMAMSLLTHKRDQERIQAHNSIFSHQRHPAHMWRRPCIPGHGFSSPRRSHRPPTQNWKLSAR